MASANLSSDTPYLFRPLPGGWVLYTLSEKNVIIIWSICIEWDFSVSHIDLMQEITLIFYVAGRLIDLNCLFKVEVEDKNKLFFQSRFSSACRLIWILRIHLMIYLAECTLSMNWQNGSGILFKAIVLQNSKTNYLLSKKVRWSTCRLRCGKHTMARVGVFLHPAPPPPTPLPPCSSVTGIFKCLQYVPLNINRLSHPCV